MYISIILKSCLFYKNRNNVLQGTVVQVSDKAHGLHVHDTCTGLQLTSEPFTILDVTHS